MSSHHQLWVGNRGDMFELLDTSLPLPVLWGGKGWGSVPADPNTGMGPCTRGQ